MSWRSSYLFCPYCNNVYFASQIRPVYDCGEPRQICPSASCDPVTELVAIDELMIKPIVNLNKKGYRTDFCCSGHETRDIYSKHGYIMFHSGVSPTTAPEGWNLEKGGYEHQNVVVRSTIDDLATSISNLNKWIEKLEERTE